MDTLYNSDKRKILSALSHGSIFLSSLVISAGIPLTILLVSDDPTVKENAKEALNFHLNVWFYGAIIGVLFWLLIGWLLSPVLLPAWFLYHWVLPIFAIAACLRNPEQPYRYPFLFRVL